MSVFKEIYSLSSLVLWVGQLEFLVTKFELRAAKYEFRVANFLTYIRPLVYVDFYCFQAMIAHNVKLKCYWSHGSTIANASGKVLIFLLSRAKWEFPFLNACSNQRVAFQERVRFSRTERQSTPVDE